MEGVISNKNVIFSLRKDEDLVEDLSISGARTEVTSRLLWQ